MLLHGSVAAVGSMLVLCQCVTTEREPLTYSPAVATLMHYLSFQVHAANNLQQERLADCSVDNAHASQPTMSAATLNHKQTVCMS